MAESVYEWQEEAPKRNGEFYFTGVMPNGENFTGIVKVFLNPSMVRCACVLIVPEFLGKKEVQPSIVFGEIDKWKGKWAGPEFGLNNVVIQS